MVEEGSKLYVAGHCFAENTLYDLAELLKNVSGELVETDTTNEAVVKLYKLIKEGNEDVDGVVKLLISEIYNLERDLNKRIDNTDEVVAAGLANLQRAIQQVSNKVDTEVVEALKNVANDAKYEEDNINFYHDDSLLYSLPAGPFVKDAVLDKVELVGSDLIFTFNTDAEKTAIRVSLTDFLNPDTLVTKTEFNTTVEEINDTLSEKVNTDDFEIAIDDIDTELEYIEETKADKEELSNVLGEEVVDD